MKGRELGFTIPEMAVSMFLLSFILLLSLGVLFPGLQTVRQAEEATVTQQQITLAFDRLFAELQEVDAGTVTDFGDGLVFLSQRPYVGSNPVVPAAYFTVSPYLAENAWTKWVYIRRNGDVVEMREFPYAGGQQLAKINASDVNSVGALGGDPPRNWIRYVDDFQVFRPRSNLLQFQVATVSRDARGVEASRMNFKVALRRNL